MTSTHAVTDTSRPAVLRQPRVGAVVALAVGVGFDVLAWERPPGPGVSVALAAFVVASWWTVKRQRELSHQARALFGAALVLALVSAFRSSAVLVGLSVLAWAGLLAAAVGRSRRGDLREWTISTYVLGLLEWPMAAVEPLWMASDDLGAGSGSPHARWIRRSVPIIRGLAVSFVVLLFFGLLLGSADPIFGDFIADVLNVDLSLDRMFRLGFVAGGVAWMLLGLARRALRRAGPEPVFQRASIGGTESIIVTGALNLLFAGFLIVQFRYLFDGSVGRVSLGYAEYARRGFFELVFVAFAVLGLVLAADWLVRRRIRWLDYSFALLIGQTFVVMISAAVRMRAYVDQFGLSELRLYTSAFMVWTAVVLGVAVFTVLRGRRAAFAFGSFISALAVLIALFVANPDAVIVNTNLERARNGHSLDVDYLVGLSPDAIPAIVGGIDSLDDQMQADLSDALDEVEARLDTRSRTWGWRSWSLAHSRATAAIRSRPDA